jgi:hypothetical protein
MKKIMRLKTFFKPWYWGFLYQDVKLAVKSKYQLWRYGFEYRDTWGLDHALAKWILPRLKHLKKNKYGCPSEFFTGTLEEQESDEGFKKALAEWDEILDEIIWSFEFILNEDEYLHACFPADFDYGFEEAENGYVENKDKRKIDFSSFDAAQKRAEKGHLLFAKNLRNLWD